MIEVGCSSHSSPTRSLALSSSLPPLYATPSHGSYMLPRCAASPFPRPLPRHRIVAVKPRSLARPLAMLHATLTPLSFSYGRLFYPMRGRWRPHSRSAVTIAFSFLVHDAVNAFEWRKIRRIYHAWS
ncbi:hypothetical protein B0H13DRAFT_2300527 [Mycena leptocephala]|nr:hypothetical protein B0H13DRAFT_2300527 [Mycena leptocephala]